MGNSLPFSLTQLLYTDLHELASALRLFWYKALTGFVRGEAACQITRKRKLVEVGLFGNRLR